MHPIPTPNRCNPTLRRSTDPRNRRGSEQENGAWVAILETTERQPFPGLYAVRVLPWAREVLASKWPSMMGFLERLVLGST